MHTITEATREGARNHIEKLSSLAEALNRLSKAGRQQMLGKMLPVMQELSLLSKTQYGNDPDIAECLLELRIHTERVCGLAGSGELDIKQQLAWVGSALLKLNEIMVLEPKSQD